MPAIVFPVSSAPGIKPQDGAGRLVNCYAVKTEQGARAPFAWMGSAGLREQFETTSADFVHCRGSIVIGSTLIAVVDERAQAITFDGTDFTVADLGEVPGTDLVTIGRNNASTADIALVCEAGTFNLYIDAPPDGWDDGDLPAANSVCGMNGYLFFTTAAGEIWATNLNNVGVQTDANTEAQMNPDGLLRGVVINDEFLAMGENSIEVYEEVGTDPFPLRFKKITIQPGLLATHAVAGWEDGWSAKLHYVSSDNNVYRLDGYTPVPVGNADVCRAIETAADKSLIEMSVYIDGVNPFVVITSPGEWTWELNTRTGSWNERASYGRDDWRARRTFNAFGMWLAGDDETGGFARIDSTFYREYRDALIWEIVSGNNHAFPAGVAIPSAHFDFTAAVGRVTGQDPIGTDPRVMISWSLDGGYKWGNEITRRLGSQGESRLGVRVNRIGTSTGKGVRFKLRISDPVHRCLMGGQMPDAEARAA